VGGGFFRYPSGRCPVPRITHAGILYGPFSLIDDALLYDTFCRRVHVKWHGQKQVKQNGKNSEISPLKEFSNSVNFFLNYTDILFAVTLYRRRGLVSSSN
jgi:hypothetical protein